MCTDGACLGILFVCLCSWWWMRRTVDDVLDCRRIFWNCLVNNLVETARQFCTILTPQEIITWNHHVIHEENHQISNLSVKKCQIITWESYLTRERGFGAITSSSIWEQHILNLILVIKIVRTTSFSSMHLLYRWIFIWFNRYCYRHVS